MSKSSAVLVFRKRLLAYSETFIADQGQRLPEMQAIFCGYEWNQSGRFLLDNSDCIVLEDHTRSTSLAKARIRSGLGFNHNWLSAIKERNPKLIHAHFFKDGLETIKLADELSVPLVTTLHGHDITKKGIAETDLSLFFERVDRVIVVSDFIRQQALTRGCPEHKLVQHYIGIDTERFDQEKQETTDPNLLFVGRLVEKKGCTYLLQAMKLLQPRFPELTLTIVGEGELKSALQTEADSLGLSVTFVGTKTAAEIRQLLASHWIFVAPSITANDGDAEGLGMVFLEAQAMATPVVSFASGGVVEAVEDGTTGLLSAEKDVKNLAANIEALLSSSERRQAMGQSGQKRVQERFNIRRQCEILEQHYQNLINS